MPALSELLERADQLETLGSHWDAVLAGSGRFVVVGGEAGSGKTVLVRRFCELAPGSAPVLRGACDALFTARPLGPFVDIAGGGGRVADAIGADGRPDEVAAALLAEVEAVGPAIVVVEDVHWADEATLDVLRLVARRVESHPALVVATYRDDELGREHPLRVFLGELPTRLARVHVPPLSEQAVCELAADAGLDGRELCAKTGGNPFFVTEVLASPGAEIPATIRDAVLARVARLGPPCRPVIETIAVVPLATESWLLEALVPDGHDGLEESLASGVVASAGDSVGFRHELARLAVEESLSPMRRREVHRAVLEALAQPAVGMPDTARLAHHADAAGLPEAVLRYAPEAAVEASALGAHREAVAQYARALRHAEQLEPEAQARLFEQHAQACYLADDTAAAVESSRAAAAIFHELGESEREADALLRVATAQRINGEVAEAVGSVDAALALLDRSPASRALAMALAASAQIAMCNGDGPSTLAVASRALRLAEDLGDTETLVHVLITIGTQEMERDESREAGHRRLTEAIRLGKDAGLDELVGRAYNNLAYEAFAARDLALADEAIGGALEFSERRGLDVWRFCALGSRAELELMRGEWDAAVDTANVVLASASAPVLRFTPLLVMGLVRARRGDPAVWDPLDAAFAMAKGSGELQMFAPIAGARAEAAWLEGRDEQILDETEALVERALRGQDFWALPDLEYWRRMAGSDASARPDSSPRGLRGLEAAERWSALGYPYEAALSRAEAGDEDALRSALDELHALGARAAAARVARMLRSRGARRIPRGPRSSTSRTPGLLTRREVEVVALVAQGMRDAEIAERLFLSERTVGNHLAAIFRKLEVRTRVQASAEAQRLGLVEPT